MHANSPGFVPERIPIFLEGRFQFNGEMAADSIPMFEIGDGLQCARESF